MFYNHARFILTMFGIMIDLTGYYLGMIYQVSYERLLWIGTTLTFAIGGFVIGGLVQKLSISSHIEKANQALYKAKEQKNSIFMVADL